MPRVSLVETMNRSFNRLQARYWGLGLMMAWVYGTWFSDGLFNRITEQVAQSTLQVSLACAIVCLMVMAFRPHKERPLPSAVVLTSAFALTITTLLFFWLPAGAPILVDAGIGGLFGGVMWIAWGELFSQMNAENRESAISASLLAFIAAIAAVWLLPGRWAGVVAAVLPVLSCLMLFMGRGDETLPRTFPIRKKPTRGVIVPLVAMAACSMLCSAAAGFVMASVLPDTLMFQDENLVLAYLLGGFLALFIAVFAVAHTKHMNFSFLYEWAIPLIVFSIAMALLGWRYCADIAMVLTCGSAIYVDVLFYVIFARITALGLFYPSETFGLFRSAVQAGFLVGVAVSARVAAQGADILPWCLLLICSCVVMLPLFMHLRLRFDHPAALETFGMVDAGSAADASGESAVPAVSIDVVDAIAAEYKLSHREAEILHFLAKGRSVPYMREVLVVSKSTIETHIKHIYAKIGVHSKQDLLDLIEVKQAAQ